MEDIVPQAEKRIAADRPADALSMELLSPAGSFETALAAFAAGADAVYAGLDAFSARASAVNLSPAELRDLLAFARPRGKKVYVTFNVLVDDAQLPEAVEKIALLEELRPDALIVQDLGVARLVHRRFPGLALHASTQLVAHNLEGVLALKELGFVRVVLARELSLADVRAIARRSGVEIEVFIHGALCYSLSGLCLFSALEKERSGNRGQCAYCCRLAYADAAGRRALPFSMKDLRLDDSLGALAEAGVVSLKIEGRMKSALYVSTVTAYYRRLLDGAPPLLDRADLETVFSRRTTTLYAHGYPAAAPDAASSPIDPESLGHLGTPIGTVKRVTKDREGRVWLRFHTSRALEKHDGLQFAAPEGGKPLGFGISEMRLALARTSVFEAPAGADVEVLLPADFLKERGRDPAAALEHTTVYCSASNALRRRFPAPSFRPADVDAGIPVDVSVALAPHDVAVAATPRLPGDAATLRLSGADDPAFHPLSPARDASRTADAVRRAFAKLGGTDWCLGAFTLADPDGLFAPASLLNGLRRTLVEKLDAHRQTCRTQRIAAALAACEPGANALDAPVSRLDTLKIRLDQSLPADAAAYADIAVALGHAAGPAAAARLAEFAAAAHRPVAEFRLALPLFTLEKDFNALRVTVKHLVRLGCRKWEAADLATLRLLRQVDPALDVWADWSLYAFNRAALAVFADFGLARFVVSPESTPANLAFYAEHAPDAIFLLRQSTPLFISLTRPAADDPTHLTGLDGGEFTSFRLGALWITTRAAPRRFRPPATGVSTRLDLSWDPPAGR